MKIQMVFQDPNSSLPPNMKIGRILAEPILINRLLPKQEVGDRVLELLRLVDLPEEFSNRYPHQLSGGQKQRIAVARACLLYTSIAGKTGKIKLQTKQEKRNFHENMTRGDDYETITLCSDGSGHRTQCSRMLSGTGNRSRGNAGIGNGNLGGRHFCGCLLDSSGGGDGIGKGGVRSGRTGTGSAAFRQRRS